MEAGNWIPGLGNTASMNAWPEKTMCCSCLEKRNWIKHWGSLCEWPKLTHTPWRTKSQPNEGQTQWIWTHKTWCTWPTMQLLDSWEMCGKKLNICWNNHKEARQHHTKPQIHVPQRQQQPMLPHHRQCSLRRTIHFQCRGNIFAQNHNGENPT